MSKDKLPKAQSGNTVDNPNLLSEQGLQESFGGYSNNVDLGPLPGKSSDPYVSSVKANKLQSETSPDEYFKNAYDNFLKDTQKEDDMRLSNPRTLDEYSENEGGRFEYYMPGGYDNEDSYAQGQSFGERMVNGIGKGLLLTGTTLLQSTVGLVNGAFAAINDGKFSSFYNNDFNNYLDSITKASEDYLPNFYTKEERNAKWYSPQYWATGNFLWDGVVKNLGFAAGAALSGGVFTGVLKALPLTSRLFAVGRGAQAATATAEGVVAGTTNRVASTLGKIRSLSDDFLGGYNAMNPGGRALVAGLATSGEAGIEALHNSNEYRQELINEHIAEYGIEPTGESLDRINAATEGAGNSTFFANMALLSATNYIQFPKILGSTYSGERAIINGLTREIERDLVYEGGRLARAAVKYPFLSRLNKIRPYTFSTSEAFEEVAQYSATVATKDYYNKGLNGEATSFMESMSVGITKGAFSNEGAKNALIGGISGSIMLGRGRFKQNKRLQEDTDAAIDLINNDETSLASVVREDIQPSDFSKETKESLNRSAQLQEERTDSIENGEVMNSKDLEADEVINYLTPRVKYGRFDLVMADLADYKALASTEAGFAQLVAEGKALETDTREAYQERLARFEETAQNFNSLWKSINLRYSSEYVTDDNGDPVEVGGKKIRKYSASVMNKMLYAATKVSDFDSRISSTSSKLTSAGINTSAVIDSIVNGDFEAYNEAVDGIKNLDEISETKDELGLALDDMAEMVGKRQEFIKTYEEIKSKPNKFTEEAMLSAVESAAQVITIQTKNGPIDVKLGIPYFAGNSPEYTSKNINDFLNGSTIGQMIVQGQDENGNLLVFIPDEGVVKTFTPAAFEKLNASPASTIRRDKKAKYYFNFKDKVFYFNKGKNEGGKVPGRLEYKDGNLYFVSLGKNNRLERKIITRNHFVAQGTSTEALVTLSETEVLTDVQKAVSTAFLSTRDLKNEKADLEEARQDNIRVIGELVEDTKKTLDVVDGKLQKASEKLAKVKEDLENIAKMVKTGEKISLNFSKATKSFTRALNTLTQMEKDITNSIQELEAEKESLQYNISYFESFIDQIYNTSEDFGDFAQKLKNDVARLKGMQKSTSKKIQYSKDILSSIADTIKEVGRLIREAIKSTVSITGDNYQYLNSLLDEVASGKNVLENWPKLKEEIVNLKLTANLVKDSKVDSKKLETTLNKLEELSSKLVELQKEYNASKEILRVFEPQIKQYELQKEQQERLRNNQTILDNLKSTEDTSTPLDDDGGVTKPDFEAEPKKSNELLIVAGVPADARYNEGMKNLLPHEKRSDEFGRNFSSMDSDQRDGLRIIYVTPETEALLGLGGLFDYMLQVPNNIVGEENIEKKKKQLAKYKATGIIQVIVNEKNEIVDQEGNVIDSSLSDNEKVNQAIYQFMPEANMLEERMRTENGKSQSPTIIESLVNAYKNWKDGILGVSKLGDSYAMDVSFGQLKESPKNSTPIEDANLDLDLEQKNVIFIPKLDQNTTKGSVSYRSVPGRVYLDLANAYVPLRNRKHTEEEANAIFDSLLELSKDPELKLRKSKDIINFLKSVVYWGQPKQLSTNSVYYAQDEQGNLVLGLSNDKTTYPYTYGSLQDSKEAIINKLTGMYNNVTSDYLKNVRAPYFQILSISEQGEVESVRWENYQTYLLSNKNANGKGSRTNPPLTTTLDKSDKNNPNRENIYFFRTEDTINYEEEQEEGAPTNLPIVDNAPTEVAVVTDNKTVNKVTLYGNVVSYRTGEITREASAVRLIMDEGVEAIIKKNSQYPREDIIKQIIREIYVKLVEDSEAQAAPTPTATPTKDDVEYRPKPKAKPTTQETNKPKPRPKGRRSGRGRNRENRVALNNRVKQNENWKTFEAFLKKNLPNVPIIRVKNIIENGAGQQAWGMFQNGAIYVYENAEIGTGYHEVFESIWAMFTDAQEKEKTLETFRNRKGTFVDRPTGTTVKYSEATEEQAKEEVAEEFRRFMLKEKPATGFIGGMFKKLKKFIEDAILFIKTKLGLREEKKQDFIDTLFKNIDSGYYANRTSTSPLATYAQQGIVDILEVKDTKGAEFRLAINERARIDIISEMMYATQLKIKNSENGLFTQPNFSESFLDDLKADVYSTMDNYLNDFVEDTNYTIEQFEKNLATAEDVEEDKAIQQREIENINRLKDDIEKNWDEFIELYKQKMLALNVKFNEDNEAALVDIDKTKDSTFQDSTKRDHYKEASEAIRLLMSTVALKDKAWYNETKEIVEKQSSIGGAILLPSTQVYITLMNNLSDSTSVEDMLDKLRKLAIADINYRPVYTKLAGATVYSSKPTLNFNSAFEERLVTSLYNTFKKSANAAKSVYILEDGSTTVGSTALSNVALQMKSKYLGAIITNAKSEKGFFTYDEENNTYSSNSRFNKYGLKTNFDKNAQRFLNDLGIVISDEEINAISSSDAMYPEFKEAVLGLEKDLRNVRNVSFLSASALQISNRLLEIATLQTAVSNPEYSSTFFVGGERRQSYLGVNVFSELYNFVSRFKNKSQLRDTQFSYLLTDVFSEGSTILKRLYTSKGNKVKASETLLETGYLAELNNFEKGKQKSPSQMNFQERLVSEFNLNEKGWYFSLVPGDASTEWMMYMGNVITDSTDTQYLKEVFQGFFESEVKLSRANRKIVEAPGRKNTDLRFFKGILGEKLHNTIVDFVQAKKNENLTAEQVYNEFKNKIDNSVISYITELSKQNGLDLASYGIIEQDQANDGRLLKTFTMKNVQGGNKLSEEALNAKLFNNTANYMIANIEQHKLIFSDPYQYKDELKRVKNFLSPRQALALGDNSGKYTSVLDKIYNGDIASDDIAWTDFGRGNFRTVTLEDVISMENLPNYTPHEETDGGGIISYKAYRWFRILASDWNADEEAQFQHDIGYEKLVKSDGVTQEKIDKYEKNNPAIKSAYTALKPIAAGAKSGFTYNNVVLDKYSLYPAAFRVMHKLNPESNIVKLSDKMNAENIDYVIFDSGRKVGAETTFPPYKNGKFNEDLYTDVVEIPFSAISVQQEVPSKEGNTVTRGSQMTKLVTLDFLDNGVPEDFEMTEADLSIRFEKWFSLSEKEKVQASDLYKDIKENQAILEALITEGYNTLLEDLGIVDRGDRTYEVVDFEKASNALQSEIFKRDINNNIIEALSAFTNGTNSLEATPAYNQVRSILYSISDKRVLRQKMIGSQKVQISSVFFEGEERKLKVVKGKNGKKTNVYESNVLDFYSKGEVNKKTGKVGETNGMEIMIGRWFDSPLSDKDLLNYLNNTEEGKTLLKGVAFRIPTQAQSSIDSFKIKAFLPKEFGDSVVVPSGIVEKVGSDFDIDKLSIYFKNVYKDIKGVLRVVPYYGIGEAAKSRFYEEVLAKSNKRKKDYEGFAERYSNNFQEVVYGDGKNLTDAQTKLKNILEAAFSKDERTIQNVEDFFEKESAKIGKELEELNDEDYQNILVAQIANKRYIESLQNGYIESLQKLILNPLNYDRLIRPNSADYLKSLADDVITEVGEDAFVYNNADKMLQKGYMARLRHAFLTGKRAIGIAAKNQTLKSFLQRTPVFMDEKKRRGLPLEVQAFLPNLNIGFKNYNTINIPGKGEVITLSGTTENSDDEVKKLISDINGQAIDGFVDISNGPWIMQMGANPNVVATFQFLNTIGVPMKDVVYFMNQPIIRDYLKMIEVKGYSWLFIDDFVSDIKYSEKYSISETLNRKPLTEIPNAKELLTTISGKNLTLKQKEQQQFYLDEFLKYAQMSSQLFKLGQGVSWDTARLNDPFLVLKKSLALEQAEKTIFSSYDFGNDMVDDAASSIINSSFLKTLIPTLLDSRDALGSIITSDKRNSEFRKVLTQVLTPYANLSDREFVKLAKKAVANIFDYVVQNDRSVDGKPLNGEISRVLLDDVKGATAQVMNFVNEVRSDINHPLYDNQVINLLEADPSKKAGKVPNNLKLSSTDQNVYDQDIIIASFRQLRDEISATPEGKRLYRKIIGIAVLQSGLTNSPISFTNLLPYENFQEIYGKLDQLSSATNLQLFKDVSAFERNNWSDNSITPYAKAFWFKNAKNKWKYNAAMIFLPKNVQIAKQNGDIPQLVSMSTLGREGRSEHIVYSWDNETLSSDSKARMRANNDYSYINKGLFKKVYRENGSPLTYTYEDKHGDIKSFFIYKHINAWGDSFRANELHDHAKKSDIDNGFLKVVFKTQDQNGNEIEIDNEKPDTAIVAAFDNPGVKVKKFPSKAVKMPVEVTNATGTVEVVSEDYGVVNVETNPSEEFTKDLIDSISENIKENAYVENGSGEANLMFSYGDQWKGNRTKKPTGKVVKVVPAQIDFDNNGSMTVTRSKYFYDSKYNNGNNVPDISEINKLKTHIENTLGIDMTDYDVSLNNIYTEDTSLYRHTDIDESNTAKGYPVIVYVLGNEHKVRIDDAGGKRVVGNMVNPKIMTLKNGDVYTLGLGGKGRFEAVHDVVKGSNKSTKYPPITLPSGKVITDYTITFTFRRVRDLEPGMPTTPNKITQPGEQTIADDLAIERAREIEELQAKKDTLDSNPEYIILSNIPKITPTSAKKETGGKVGVNQDINPSWLSRKGVSVEKAAEDIFANHFAESEEYSEAEIRDFIIDILSKSKLEANREIFDERRLTELLEYKQPTQKTNEVELPKVKDFIPNIDGKTLSLNKGEFKYTIRLNKDGFSTFYVSHKTYKKGYPIIQLDLNRLNKTTFEIELVESLNVLEALTNNNLPTDIVNGIKEGLMALNINQVTFSLNEVIESKRFVDFITKSVKNKDNVFYDKDSAREFVYQNASKKEKFELISRFFQK